MQKMKIVIKKGCHSRKFLSGIPTSFNNTQGGDPRLQASGMTLNFNNTPSSVLTGHLPPHGEAANFNAPSTWRERVTTGRVRGKIARGFTLIELLVVVLIIGILAAVALPQYQFAIMRSRYATIKHLTKSIAEAERLYYLGHGTYTTNWDALDIQMPPGGPNTSNVYVFNQGQCWIDAPDTFIQISCSAKPDNITYKHYVQNTERFCVASSADQNDKQNLFCKKETGRSSGYVGSSFTMWKYQ